MLSAALKALPLAIACASDHRTPLDSMTLDCATAKRSMAPDEDDQSEWLSKKRKRPVEQQGAEEMPHERQVTRRQRRALQDIPLQPLASQWWTKNGGSLSTMLRDKSSVLTSMLRAGIDGKDPGKVAELQDHVQKNHTCEITNGFTLDPVRVGDKCFERVAFEMWCRTKIGGDENEWPLACPAHAVRNQTNVQFLDAQLRCRGLFSRTCAAVNKQWVEHVSAAAARPKGLNSSAEEKEKAGR